MERQRTALQAQGYDFSFGYTGEYAGILDSKQTSTHGSAYTGQLALGSHLDLGKILGGRYRSSNHINLS